jgi:universal stress protein A
MLPKKILFCADFSENSEPARELAVDYAKAFGAQLLIVHVIDSNSFPDYVDWVGEEHSADWTDEALKQILKRTQEHAKDRLESLESECAKGVEQVKTCCRIGLPSKEIAALAAEESVDLIVMGTHGRTGVKHLVMGSIARSVLKTAHRPVLIVEAPPERGESS